MKKILAGLMAFGMSICVFSCSDSKKTDDISEESSKQENNIETYTDDISEESPATEGSSTQENNIETYTDDVSEESPTTEESPTQEEDIEEIYLEIAESFMKYVSESDYDGLLELYYPSDILETAKTIAEIEGVNYLEYTELDEMCDDSDISDIHIDEIISVEPLDSEILEEINYDFSGVYALAEYIEETGVENITPETLREKYMEDWSVSTTITKGYEIKSTVTMTYKNKKAETGLQATSQLYYVDGEGWKMYADE